MWIRWWLFQIMLCIQRRLHCCLVIFHILDLLHPVVAPKVIEEDDIINRCWSTIKVLPIFNPYTEPHQRLVDCRNLHEYSISQIRAKLFGICKVRYFELIRYAANDNELLMTNDRNNNTLKKRNLFVLDLDESLEFIVSFDSDC